jgi:hypothetical protein
MAVYHFMKESAICSSADEFMLRNSVLLGSNVMLTHYSAELLFSGHARQAVIPPDIEAIPTE